MLGRLLPAMAVKYVFRLHAGSKTGMDSSHPRATPRCGVGHWGAAKCLRTPWQCGEASLPWRGWGQQLGRHGPAVGLPMVPRVCQAPPTSRAHCSIVGRKLRHLWVLQPSACGGGSCVGTPVAAVSCMARGTAGLLGATWRRTALLLVLGYAGMGIPSSSTVSAMGSPLWGTAWGWHCGLLRPARLPALLPLPSEWGVLVPPVLLAAVVGQAMWDPHPIPGVSQFWGHPVVPQAALSW